MRSQQVISLQSITIILASFLFTSSCTSKEAENKPMRPTTSIHASIADSVLTIAVTVPEGHHAYLDAGAEGNLIPITFDWTGLGTAEPKALKKPSGVFDENVRATVLRGQGQFQFEAKADWVGKTIRVRSQICDDRKGLCYPPSFQNIQIQSAK